MSQWYIIRVVGARERHVAGELERGLGLKTYYPLEVFKITRGAKTIKKERPLMPNYVFASSRYGMPWRDVAAIKGVIDWRKMAGSDVPYMLPDDGIERIRQLAHEFNRAKTDTRTRKLSVGDRVRIDKGPFMSMETLLTTVTGREVKFMTPLGIATAPATSVSLVA